MTTRARLTALFAMALVPATLLLAISADAQHAKPRKPPNGSAKDAGVTAPALHTGAATADAPKANPDGGVLEAKTLDGGTRVFRFGEMEVEGRLRSPQIVYFLRRVRAEFAAGDLGHRSFMGELSDTRKGNAF